MLNSAFLFIIVVLLTVQACVNESALVAVGAAEDAQNACNSQRITMHELATKVVGNGFECEDAQDAYEHQLSGFAEAIVIGITSRIPEGYTLLESRNISGKPDWSISLQKGLVVWNVSFTVSTLAENASDDYIRFSTVDLNTDMKQAVDCGSYDPASSAVLEEQIMLNKGPFTDFIPLLVPSDEVLSGNKQAALKLNSLCTPSCPEGYLLRGDRCVKTFPI